MIWRSKTILRVLRGLNRNLTLCLDQMKTSQKKKGGKEKTFHTCLLEKNLGHGTIRGSSEREEGFHSRFQRVVLDHQNFQVLSKYLERNQSSSGTFFSQGEK